VPPDQHHVVFGSGEIRRARTVDVAGAQGSADAELRWPGADQFPQPPIALITALVTALLRSRRPAGGLRRCGGFGSCGGCDDRRAGCDVCRRCNVGL
jgi:hypothetical protein